MKIAVGQGKRPWVLARQLYRFYQTDPNGVNTCIVNQTGYDLEIEHRTINAPQENEALVAVDSNLLNPNDYDNWVRSQFVNNTNKTMIIGSFASGIIMKLGSGESNGLKEGDKVAIEPGLCCLKCKNCLSGRTNLCIHKSYIGTQRDGTLAKFITHPTEFCHKLDQNVSFELATLLPLLSCSLNAYHRMNATPTSKVCIIGAGLMSLILLLTLKHMGIQNIFVAAVSDYRMDAAKQLGAKYVIKIAPMLSPEYPEYMKEIIYAVQNEYPDITVDTLCTIASFETAYHMTEEGGKLVMLAYRSVPTPVPFMVTTAKEVDIISSSAYTRANFQEALKLLLQEKASFEKLLISFLKVPLQKAINAFSYARATSRENICVLVKNNYFDHERETTGVGFKENNSQTKIKEFTETDALKKSDILSYVEEPTIETKYSRKENKMYKKDSPIEKPQDNMTQTEDVRRNVEINLSVNKLKKFTENKIQIEEKTQLKTNTINITEEIKQLVKLKDNEPKE